jgi:hypothetical protein
MSMPGMAEEDGVEPVLLPVLLGWLVLSLLSLPPHAANNSIAAAAAGAITRRRVPHADTSSPLTGPPPRRG